MDVRLVRPTAAHVVMLAASMREADERECWALGLSPFRALKHSVGMSDFVGALLVDGQVAAMAGLVLEAHPAVGRARSAQAWLLTGRAVERAPLAFHRTAREWLRQAHGFARVLWNVVDARYTASLRWLEALGFCVHAARPHGPLEMPFHLVTREA
jgi:hypothetical protein